MHFTCFASAGACIYREEIEQHVHWALYAASALSCCLLRRAHFAKSSCADTAASSFLSLNRSSFSCADFCDAGDEEIGRDWYRFHACGEGGMLVRRVVERDNGRLFTRSLIEAAPKLFMRWMSRLSVKTIRMRDGIVRVGRCWLCSECCVVTWSDY